MENTLKPSGNLNIKRPLGEVYDVKGKPYRKFVVVCPRCGGSGHYSYCERFGTMCFECEGKGEVVETRRVYTEKELQAMERRKLKLEEKKKAEWEATQDQRNNEANQKFKKNLGFIDSDEMYIIAMDNTYNIKDELKSKGASWVQYFRSWVFQNDNCKDEYPLKKVEFNEISEKNEYGLYQINDDKVRKVMKSLEDPEFEKSQYFGKIGERVELEIEVKKVAFLFESKYGSTYLNIMIDNSGNKFTWKTSKVIGDEGEKLKIKATIKDHGEYELEKQTELTRCKVL